MKGITSRLLSTFGRFCVNFGTKIGQKRSILTSTRSSGYHYFANSNMKYILVTGGVISGVGKGIISSSLGVLLKSHGFRVSAIKIDPYINIDAGTFSPYEHGEVFVLDDGGEVDLDLGNYERFLDLSLRRDNNITTGKIYKHVIDRERRGDYLGKTVQELAIVKSVVRRELQLTHDAPNHLFLVVPHITDAIQEWVYRVARQPVDNLPGEPDVCIIELGGTIGDIEGMPFVEAFRQFIVRVSRDNFLNVHVSLVLEPKSTGEQKTKPTQNSVKELRCLGLFPDLVVCRSVTILNESVRRKISNYCDVPPEQVIDVHDVSNIYHVPLLLYNQGVLGFLRKRLHLDQSLTDVDKRVMSLLDSGAITMSQGLTKWKELAIRVDRMHETVHIALVGKYVQLEDAYTSVSKALKHAAAAAGRRLVIDFILSEDLEEAQRSIKPAAYHEAWKLLTAANGVLVPGGFGERGIEGKIAACGWARTMKKPFLGICLGLQCAVIEFARAKLGKKNAHSTEFKTGLSKDNQMIIDMPEHSPDKDGQGMGATMRLGRRTTVFLTKDSKLRKLYGDDVSAVEERHRHRYEVNPEFVPQLTEMGLLFVGMGVDEGNTGDILVGDDMKRTESSQALLRAALSGELKSQPDDLRKTVANQCAKKSEKMVRMEIIELQDHPYFVGVQFHPEYLTQPLKPSPPYVGLLLAASGQLDEYLRGTKIPSPISSIMDISQRFGSLHMNGTTSPRRILKSKASIQNPFMNGYSNGNSEEDGSQFSSSI